MKRALIRQITVGLAVALSLLVVNAAVSYRNILKLIENEQQVSHTHMVLATLEGTLSTLKDAQTGQRGYLLTGKERYLEPYYAAIKRVQQQVTTLRQLTADNQRQQQRIQALEQAIATQLAELRETIQLRQNQGLEAALKVVQTDRGKQIMDSIRRQVAVMAAEENQLLQQRAESSKASVTTTLLTFTLAIGLNGLLLLLLYYLIRRHEVKRQQEAEVQRQLIMELKSSEEKFRQLAENINAVFWISSPQDGRLLYVSPAYERIWGRSCESLYAVSEWVEASYQEDRERVKRSFFQQALIGTYDQEYRIVRPDGAVRWIRDRGFPVKNHTGELYRVVGIAEDITERKQAEERYRYIFDTVEVSIWEEDFSAVKAALATLKAQGVQDFSHYFMSHPEQVGELVRQVRVLDVNEATLRMFGAEDKQQFLSALDQTFVPESIEVFAQELCALAEERTSFESEVVVQTLQGKRLNILISIKFPPPTATSSNVLVSMTDITELRRTAERLQLVHDIDQAILTLTSPQAIAHTALSRLQQLLDCNQAAVILFDVAANQAQIFAGKIGSNNAGTVMSLSECVPLGFIQRQNLWYVPKLAHLQARPVALEQQLAAGLHSFLMVPLRNDNNIIGGVALYAEQPDAFSSVEREIAHEVASQLAIAIQQSRLREELHGYTQQLEQRVVERTAALQEANQELEAFTYSVSHDLRAPLRTIQGFAQALQEDYGDCLDDMAQDYIRYMAEGAVQMDTLIADLLAYSRLSRIDIVLQCVDLNAVVEAALKQLSTQIQERRAHITIKAPLPAVQAHRPTLVQVITNLLSNAMKFVPPGIQPKVQVYAQQQQDSIRLWVVDNGIGIAPEHQERIFRVFERLHGVEIYPGTGIGLAIVRKGLERMGGRVGVESQLEQGSRFWIQLPYAE